MSGCCSEGPVTTLKHKGNESCGASIFSGSDDSVCSSASKTTGTHGSDSFGTGMTDEQVEERIKRWALRKEEKRRSSLQKRLHVQALVAEPQANSDLDVETVLRGKSLPIGSVEYISKGNYAKVYRGVLTQACYGCLAQSTVAVKVINKNRSHVRHGEDGAILPPKWLEREVSTSYMQDHDNLVRVFGALIETTPYVILLEYCSGGSLKDAVAGDVSVSLLRISWDQRLKVALDIAVGMTHLHEQRIVHRDLKTQNVLLAEPVRTTSDLVHAKICDFGLARYLPSEDHQTRLTQDVGTWYFMAPEVCRDESNYDQQSDVFSYAMVLYEMMVGDIVFASRITGHAFVVFVSDGGRPTETAIPPSAPAVLQELMRAAWVPEPAARPTFCDIAERLRGCDRAPGMNAVAKRPTEAADGASGLFSLFGCCISRRSR